MIDDLVLIALARRSGYKIENARDAEKVIIFGGDGYPIGIKEKDDHGSPRTLALDLKTKSSRAQIAGVAQDALDITRVNNPILLGVMPELASALGGLDYSVIHNGVIRFGNLLFKDKRYVLLNGQDGTVKMDNGDFEGYEIKKDKNGDLLVVKFKNAPVEVLVSEPVVLVKTKHGIDEKQITYYSKDYTFVPGDEANYQRALKCLQVDGWYKVIKLRPLRSDIYFVAKFKTCIKNGRNNLLLFFHNGRCLEIYGRKGFQVILHEVGVKT